MTQRPASPPSSSHPRGPAHRAALLLLALGLGGVATVDAAPVPQAADTGAQAQCPAPDAAKCRSKGYLDSACGQQHHASCRATVQKALKAFAESHDAPQLPMLRPSHTQIPEDLVDGKYFAYEPGAGLAGEHASNTAKAYRKSGDIMRMRTGMSMSAVAPVDLTASVPVATAAAFHRNPAWDANGDRVESCEEFAYERNYDVTRYIDAASACKGDRECIFGVTYLADRPGIASRTLEDTGGRDLPKLPLPAGKFPKNDMFAFTSINDIRAIVRANGMKQLAPTPEMIALETALLSGGMYYRIGECSGASCDDRKKFSSAWRWHKRLHDRTVSISQAEADEYARRKAEFRALFERWAAAVDHERSKLDQAEVKQIVLPYDMVTTDPFDRYVHAGEMVEHVRDVRTKTIERWGKGILDKTLEQALEQVHGARGGISPTAALALPRPAASAAWSAYAPAQPQAADKPSFMLEDEAGSVVPGHADGSGTASNPCLRTEGWGLEMHFAGPAACKLGRFLRNEWARKTAGQRSCLDLDNDHCDWTREMFDAAVLAKVPLLDKQLADEQYCKAWRDGGTFPKNSVAAVQSQLQQNEAAFAEAWPLIKAYDRGLGPQGRKLGKTWQGGDYLGEKSWFAAGYDYDVGWDVESVKKNHDGLVCELGGSLHAKTGFDAWIVGNRVEVVDGSLEAQSNTNGNGKVRFKGHLEMLDESVFSTGGWKMAAAFGDEPDGDLGLVLPRPKPRFDIYVGVPISGELWGELLFGSSLTARGDSQPCDPAVAKPAPTFGLSTTFSPLFAAYGVGQVGVGISGVASAGIRAALTLVMVQLPVDVGMRVQKVGGAQSLSFDSGLSLLLETLSGRVSLYLEFLMVSEEFELFRWRGIGPATVPLMPRLSVDVPLAGMD
ncbi:MAG: hypothetical protein U0168_24415 [Nannocystaceae bacterium]